MKPSAPLYHALCAHLQKQRVSLHTPGHKHAHPIFPQDLSALDLTELPDTDSLFEAEGAILAAERETAQVLGVARTLFSAGGCTLCIQAMLRLASMGGKRNVIAGRVLHRSAVHTMALLGLTPVWVMPRADAGPGLPGRVHPQDVRQALLEHPDAACVYVTSPDYFGVLADIAGIAKACQEYHVPLLVDNAHGAHLFFTSQPHPITQGAAMTACSAHKTLPVLTGGAWLNLAGDLFLPAAKDAMALFGSTSPSYPVMASLDLCTGWLHQYAATAYPRLEGQVRQILERAVQLGFGIPQGPCDPTRISLYTPPIGLTGEQTAQYLRQSGIEPEYADASYVVMIPTPCNSPQDFERLEDALQNLPRHPALPETSCVLPPLPPAVLSVREAVLHPSVELPIAQAVGKTAACAACPCPPGVPVVMPGEKITPSAAEFLLAYGFSRVKVLQ